jgi:hypothetical protein
MYFFILMNQYGGKTKKKYSIVVETPFQKLQTFGKVKQVYMS